MKKILILGGGISKEREISLETTKQVNSVLRKKYKTKILNMKKMGEKHEEKGKMATSRRGST